MNSKNCNAILFATFMLLAVAHPITAQQSEGAKTQPGKFQMTVSKGYVSLEANEASLAKIFEEIGKQAAITIESGIGPEEKITIKFDNVPVEDAITQLAKNVSFIYAQDPKTKSTRIARVVVLPEGKDVAGRVKPPVEVVKTKEPAPEPFKFEFDPSKFSEKEKR